MIKTLTIKIKGKEISTHINKNGYFCFQYNDINLPDNEFRDIISKQTNIPLSKIAISTSESEPTIQTTFTSPKCYFVKIIEL